MTDEHSMEGKQSDPARTYDLVIVGGGPVGMALVLALRGSGISVLLLEARGLPEETEDARPLALSHGSRLILERLGVWRSLPSVTPITTIHVSSRGSFGRTVMTAGEVGVPALGYVVNHHDVFRSMHRALKRSGADYLTAAQALRLKADADVARIDFQHGDATQQAGTRLLVLADGGRLAAQVEGVTQHVRDYRQWAVVARVRSEYVPRLPEEAALPGLPVRGGGGIAASPAEAGVAYERFTPDGPVALLPMGEYFALVWTLPPAAAQGILALDETAFLARLHDRFGDRLGRFVEAGKRSGFPLALKYADPVTAPRVALVGNAAQTLHPVAGQGFNLGLRDAWELAREIIASPTEAGSSAMLARYRDRRRMDSGAGRIFTDSLVKLFSNDDPLLGSLRGAGLGALDCLPQVRRFVARRMMFGARG
ncbi:FAD-dependent monooxygenase [Nitrosovibrio sp. Nv17]|uniref:FAD-dependent monooxygenase n=1 Tax=Nitrosovibrio sp. Nv17 TaxID=1855339 RepID=UPI000908C4A6|nr:FAD-dependent monooxygenase [Nitrosovibrio sp. Nv17]SFW31548.1 2-octaprenyl-6-methoxyphenol hydroxylase [Nitrosovibrio sp. Nv17]